MSQIKTVGEILLEKLRTGRALFAYKKADGSLRPAIGTLNSKFIPSEKLDFKAGSNNPTKQDGTKSIVYYDLEKDAWRSCNVGNLLDLDKE